MRTSSYSSFVLSGIELGSFNLCNMNLQKIAKAITLVGLATTMTGLTFKLNHFMGAPMIFNIGAAILVIGFVLWRLGLIQKRKLK